MHTAIVARDADGVPTGISAITKETFIGGMIAAATTIVNEDKVVIADTLVEKVAVSAVPVAIGAYGQMYVDRGELNLIPFKKA